MIPKQSTFQLPLNTRIKKRIKLILEKKKIVIISLFSCLFLAATISFLLPKSYQSRSKIFFKSVAVNNNILSNTGNYKNELDLLYSEKLLKNTATTLAQEGFAVSINDILESSEILEDLGSAAISVSIISDNAIKSAKINNTLVQKFKQYCSINSKSSLIKTLNLLKEREESLLDFVRTSMAGQQGNAGFAMSAQQDILINQISQFESELEIIEIENQYLSASLKELEVTLDSQFPNVNSDIKILDNTELNATILKLQRLEAKNNLSQLTSNLNNFNISYPWQENYNLAELSDTYTRLNNNLDKQIDIIISNSEIKNEDFLKQLTKKIYNNRIKTAGIDLSKSIIFNTMTALEEKFNMIPFEIMDEVRRTRTKRFNVALGLKLKTKEKRFRDLEPNLYSEIESITDAKIPTTYFSPNTTLNIILGGILGLIIGLFFAANSDTVKIELIRGVEDLEEAGYKIVAQIPSFPKDSPLLFDELNKQDEKKVDVSVLNAFNSIETFLKYGSLENPLKTVLITSGQAGEGKSIIASNIAIALANTDHKVLLVDADLKTPLLHKLFRIKSTPSLAHFLFRKKEFDEIVRKTHNKNLDLITCIEFPQNPLVIITSERMNNFMENVRDKYDYIIYDSSSLCSLKETAVMAQNIDEVILVVRANKSKLSEINNSVDLLFESGVHEFDIVLNDVNA